MKFKEGDKIRIKSLNEMDKSHSKYNEILNVRHYMDSLENERGEVIKEIDGALQINIYNCPESRFWIFPEYIDLLLEKDNHQLGELLTQILDENNILCDECRFILEYSWPDRELPDNGWCGKCGRSINELRKLEKEIYEKGD